MKKTLIALGLVVGIAAVPAVANATPGHYTRGANVTVYLTSDGGCATAYYPRGGEEFFCGTKAWKQYNIQPGNTYGANVAPYTLANVYCRVVDDATGDTIKADFGYRGGAALCLLNAI